MSTKTADKAPKAPKAPKEKKEKLPKYAVKMRDGEKNTLRFTAKQREKDAVSFATHTVRNAEGKPTHTRGAYATHPSFDEAKAAVAKGVENATKLGWLSRKGGGGGSKKDSFSLDSLPAPKAAVAAPASA